MSGVFASSRILEKQKTRKEFIKMLLSIESAVKYTSMTLDEILKRYSFDKYSDFILEEKNTDMANILPSSEEKDIMTEFFSEFGKSYSRDKELKLCRHSIEKMQKLDNDLSKDEQTKARLYRKLSLIIAGLLAIILI